MSILEESQIISNLRTGGSRALASYFAAFRQGLKKYIGARLDSRLSRRLDSSDIVQDAFLRARKDLRNYLRNPAMAFYPWLQVMCHQSVVESMKKHFGTQARSITKERPIESATLQPVSDSSPSAIVSRQEACAHARDLIGQLSVDDANIIRLHHFDQLSIAEIGVRFGISANAASKRHQRALTRLSNLARK